MLRRLDVIRNEKGEFEVVNTSNEKLKNWIIEIKNDKLFVIGLSNSRKTNQRIKEYPLKEGSLFLYNTTFNWYSFFRDKTIQCIFDKYNINKCIKVNEDRIKIHLPYLYGKCINPILFIQGYELIEDNNPEFKIEDGRGELIVKEQVYQKTGRKAFIIQENVNTKNRIIYADKDFDLQDLDWEIQ